MVQVAVFASGADCGGRRWWRCRWWWWWKIENFHPLDGFGAIFLFCENL
jgi:hypothetical protein